MKTIFFLSVIFFTNWGCVTTNIENDLLKRNIKGKVKSITYNTYYAVEKFGEIERGELTPNDIFFKQSLIEKFNLAGNISEVLNSWDVKRKVYTYDNKNQLIEEKYVGRNIYGTQIFKFKYDKNGKEIECIQYDISNKVVSKTINIYDEILNKIESNQYDGNGNLMNKIKCKYFEGNLVEENCYNSIGELSYKDIFSYDNNGFKIEEVRYDGKMKIISKSVFQNNLLISFMFHSKGTNTFKYKFDSNGNWFEQISFDENNKPMNIDVRKIEYY